MSNYRIIIGVAAEVAEPIDGEVRNYTDEHGKHWVGTYTNEVEYFDSSLCLSERIESAYPDAIGALAATSQHASLTGDTLDVEHVYGDWPDYTVYCAQCGDVVHTGNED